jgi:hypothetical protein
MARVRTATLSTAAATRGVLGQVLVWLTLVAFLASGFVTQTHIHVPSNGVPAAVDLFDGIKSGPAKAPVKNDQQNCPLCQAFASAGHFVTPAAAAALAPTITVSVITLAQAASHLVPQVTHIWRGRAPPRTQAH